MTEASKSRIELLKQYIAEDPSDFFSQYALALEYANEGNRAAAVSLLTKILEKDTSYLPAYYQLGILHHQAGDIDKAKDAFGNGIPVAQQKRDMKTLSELRNALDALEDE